MKTMEALQKEAFVSMCEARACVLNLCYVYVYVFVCVLLSHAACRAACHAAGGYKSATAAHGT